MMQDVLTAIIFSDVLYPTVTLHANISANKINLPYNPPIQDQLASYIKQLETQ
jgi:hypothetical protein